MENFFAKGLNVGYIILFEISTNCSGTISNRLRKLSEVIISLDKKKKKIQCH